MSIAYRGARRAFALLAVLAFLSGCAPLISEFNADAYKNATTLKAETLALVDKSGEAYATRRIEVETLTTKIDAAYEYAAGLPANQITAQQWQILRNPEGRLYGSFVRIWRTRGKVGDEYRVEKKAQLAEAYDLIICLEVNKKESKSCSSIAAAGPKE